MLHRCAGACTLVLIALAVACQGSDSSRTEEEPAADTVAIALEQYDIALFDSITWKSDADAHARGGVVWSVSCSKCHGNTGLGDGKFVMKGDTLKPPSFLAADWQYADDRAALRQKIFIGTNTGMPHWGLVGLRMRDIDAVSRYILEVLRQQGKITTY